jgi:septation ring formation regulator EzrA
MNEQLETYARTFLKENLPKLPESWQHRFRQMYSPDDLQMDMQDVVDCMPTGKLDWAMQQVSNSFEKLNKKEGV